jgi:hypothetical protein
MFVFVLIVGNKESFNDKIISSARKFEISIALVHNEQNFKLKRDWQHRVK